MYLFPDQELIEKTHEVSHRPIYTCDISPNNEIKQGRIPDIFLLGVRGGKESITNISDMEWFPC